MKFKLKQFEIDKDDPFGPSDILNRKAQGEALANLIQNVEPPFVIALNSPWGTGKTTFVHQMKQYLENQDHCHPCVYFNAWETDYHSDPIIAFTSEIIDVLSENGNSGAEQKKNIEKLKETAGKISQRLLPLLLKFLTRGAIDLDKEIEDFLADGAAAAASELVDAYKGEKDLLEEFKRTLGAAIDNLETNCKRLPLVIFVDELDRCRPTYAIELLERIKHIFDVDNVVFLCSIEKQQLMVSLSSVYGSGTNSNGYLKRFFDLEITLQRPNRSQFTGALVQKFGLANFFKNRKVDLELEEFFESAGLLFSIFDADLRAQEHCMSAVAVAALMTPENQYLFPRMLLVLITLKVFVPDLYHKYAFGDASGKATWEALKEKYPIISNLNEDDKIPIQAELIIAKMARSAIQSEDNQYYTELVGNPREEVERTRLGEYLALFSRGYPTRRPQLSYIVNKIELSDISDY
ncbi:KAP family P-loop NTPase fold protein [Maritalea sp. S77]|uniref:KAP family P-loop NTPase fold protein n=1 Tax=Maritalea sp. S77 TaxID=3415125 RepID=UPI003C7CCE20